MQPEHQPEHLKDPHAAALGQRGGQKRMAQLNTQERSALAKHAAPARWHPLEAKARRERAEEIVYLIKQALKDGELAPSSARKCSIAALHA
jgi:hypothetical protein